MDCCCDDDDEDADEEAIVVKVLQQQQHYERLLNHSNLWGEVRTVRRNYLDVRDYLTGKKEVG